MTVHIDYYELLGIQRGADDKAIKAAFRKAAMECHPDRHGGCPERTAKFKQLNEAYDCLKDRRSGLPTIALAMLPSRMAGQGAAASAAGRVRTSPTSSRPFLASSWTRAAPARMQRAARTSATTSN
jgi:molecular chaperone DnaJ